MRKVYWHKKALHAFQIQKFWYLVNKGEQFVESYQKNIVNTISQIEFMPAIGMNISNLRDREDREYRKILAHPKTYIYYWYNETELHILDIRSTMKK